jgi:Peptidase family M23
MREQASPFEKLKNYLPTALAVSLLIMLLAFKWGEKDVYRNNPSPDEDAEAALPQGYFDSPVSGQVRLTGTFGELRPDHFHSGLDYKSATGRVGQPIFAAADGFVDRIRVQASGYGNVLYIKHPNGFTTLYAHLDEFNSELAAYVKAQQYKKEQFEVDLTPEDGKFRVKKGQEIGKMGNSGSSSGPHLHFEIRYSVSGKALNPERFGLPIPDDVAPDIRDMKVYFLDEQRQVIGSKAFPLQKDKKGSIGIQGDTFRLGGWRVGFGIKAYDAMTGFKNDNGIYELSMHVDGELAYAYRMEELEFDETRYMNAHIDYPTQKRQGTWFHRLFLLPGNKLANYRATESKGAITLYQEKPVKIDIKVGDAHGNTSELHFYLLRDAAAMEEFPPLPYNYSFQRETRNQISQADFGLEMESGCLYEDLKLTYETSEDQSSGIYSSVHHIHDTRTPVHRSFEIKLKPFGLPEELKSKAVIANCGYGRPENCGGTWQGEYLHTRVRHFGDFCVMADTEPPKISPVVFEADMRKKKTMAFGIRDNFGVDGTADGLRYRGEIDGQWVLFEYDKKRNRLTHTFDHRTAPGDHRIKMSVKDDRGNESIFERDFRK